MTKGVTNATILDKYGVKTTDASKARKAIRMATGLDDDEYLTSEVD